MNGNPQKSFGGPNLNPLGGFGGPNLGPSSRKKLRSLLQFGGSGNDYIGCLRVLADGDYVVAGYTTSNPFCGYDTSAYTNGTYNAYFIAVIDKTLPKTGAIKRIKFLSGASSKQLGREYTTNAPKVCLFTRSGVEHIAYGYGTYANWGGAAAAADWKMYSLITSDFSDGPNQVAPAGGVHNSVFAPVGVDATNIFISTFQNGYGGASRVTISTFTDPGGSTVTPLVPAYAVMGSDAFYVISQYASPQYMLRYTGVATAQVDFAAVFADSSYKQNLCEVGSNILICDTKTGSTNYLLTLRTKANMANKPAGWTDYELTGFDNYYSSAYYDSESGNILLLYTHAGTGTLDLRLLVINATTGALVRNVPVTYNGVSIAQASKSFTTNLCEINKIGTNRYAIGGATNGDLPRFTNAGGYDIFLSVINDEGVIIS